MYWGTVFLFSFIVYLVPALACLIIALAMDVPSLSPSGAILMLILLFIVFIPECLLASLVCSFFFEKYETAAAVLPNVFIWVSCFVVSLLFVFVVVWVFSFHSRVPKAWPLHAASKDLVLLLCISSVQFLLFTIV
jgi:hypothetical protein